MDPEDFKEEQAQPDQLVKASWVQLARTEDQLGLLDQREQWARYLNLMFIMSVVQHMGDLNLHPEFGGRVFYGKAPPALRELKGK